MTTPSTELDKAIACLRNGTFSPSAKDWIRTLIDEYESAAKRCQQLEQMFTAHSNAELLGETERCQFEALKVKVKQLEQQIFRIGEERDRALEKVKLGIDAAKRVTQLELDVNLGIESQQALVKERDSFATTIHQQHFGRYGIVELQQQLFQLRAEYKKALKALNESKISILDLVRYFDTLDTTRVVLSQNIAIIEAVLSTPLAIETMKDQTI